MVKLDRKRLGLIVNPVAGLGGRVGLKGSDGAEIQRKALELGAIPQAHDRALRALEMLKSLRDQLEVITYPQEMGEDASREGGLEPRVFGTIKLGKTTAEDTTKAALEMQRLDVDLLLFAGGDGTARDIYNAVGQQVAVLGIPAGVKIHSAVFGASPTSAGELAASYLQGRVSSLREAEVMDIDEEAFRQGILSAKLYGYLRIPFRKTLVQSLKAASDLSEEASQRAIACHVVDGMEDDCVYVLGPGTTIRAITDELGLSKTLLGVDVVRGLELVATDVNESQLLELLQGARAKIVVTPIGGQGYIFGRGNQQISPEVIKKVGRDNIVVVSTAEKLHSLRGGPLRVDTGDRVVDEMLGGYVKVVVQYNEQTMYKVAF
ncbi:MAG: ATP-NAD kinase [Anaerolineae bacterium]|nr:ATP-NAD kinase [Anaerolineae bacterium]NIN93451.1 ATP-NAD kinase [Anaerolineae bacterium]NIQ76551.1 ATP-NAD kinase [Anaerolineae bacterium]